MKLWDLKINATTTIQNVANNIPETFAHRLKDLGLIAGESVTCLRRPPFGAPRIYMIGACVLSLDEEISGAVTVEEPT